MEKIIEYSNPSPLTSVPEGIPTFLSTLPFCNVTTKLPKVAHHQITLLVYPWTWSFLLLKL